MQIILFLFLFLFFLAGLAFLFFAPGIREFYYKYPHRNLKRFGLQDTVWNRYPGPWILRLSGVIMIIFMVILVDAGLRSRDCSWISPLNPDVYCRITDCKEDKTIVEYFNRDTNDLKLYIRQNGHDRLIAHPDGKVKIFHDAIDQNTIRFNPADENTLLVNGGVFLIMQK